VEFGKERETIGRTLLKSLIRNVVVLGRRFTDVGSTGRREKRFFQTRRFLGTRG
jgi:hypothetical protein